MSHFPSRFGPKFSKLFRRRKSFHPKSCEIAQKSARPGDARPPQHSDGSSQGRLSTATTRPAGFVAFSISFRTEIFEIFPAPQKFSSEIVRDRAEVSPAGRRPTSTALQRGLKRSAEHWRDAACEFCRVFHRVSDRKFPNCFAAAKFFIRNRARSRRNQSGRTTPDLHRNTTGPYKVG